MNAAAQQIAFVEQEKQAPRRPARKRDKNLFCREGVYYFRAQIDGKRYFESLGTGDKATAMERARVKRQAIKDQKWAALDETRIKRQTATLGEVCDAYERMMTASGRVRASTLAVNVQSLLRVAATAAGSDNPRELSAAVLTTALARKYAARLAPEEAPDKDAEASIRRTIGGTLTHARSVVRQALWEEYEEAGVKLPDVSGFLGAFVTVTPKHRYRMPAESLCRPTIEAGRKLTGTLGLVWTLAYDLGMRAAEIAAARWSWIEEEHTPAGIRRWMLIEERDGFVPKGISGRVPVFPGVWKRLQELRGDSLEDRIIPGATDNARLDVVKREFSAWMRGCGWKTQKCAHELRKLRGCWWFGRYGVERAYKWIRHANIQTTLDYYADLSRWQEPEWIEAPDAAWGALLPGTQIRNA